MTAPRLWREGATQEELAAVMLIDEEMAQLAARRRVLANERQHIANRACARARAQKTREAMVAIYR